VKVFAQRFQELTDQLGQVAGAETRKVSQRGGSSYQHIEEHLILNWSVKARNLIGSACGRDSEWHPFTPLQETRHVHLR